MAPEFRHGGPLEGVRVQDDLEQVLAVERDPLGRDLLPAQDLFVEQFGVRVFEGQLAANHREQDHPATPDVCAQPLLGLARHHFGGRLTRTPAGGLQELVRLVRVAQPEVDYFDVVLLVEQEILGFEVAVHDADAVDLLDALEDLLQEFAGFFFIETGILDNLFK